MSISRNEECVEICVDGRVGSDSSDCMIELPSKFRNKASIARNQNAIEDHYKYLMRKIAEIVRMS